MNEERNLDHCGAVTGKVRETINQLVIGLRKRETLVRYLIYLSVPVFLVISLFIGRYQMDPFQTIQVLVLGVSDQVLSFIHNAGHAVLPSVFTGEFTPQSYELKGETVSPLQHQASEDTRGSFCGRRPRGCRRGIPGPV